ncbi:2,4'-dihydroxyacetophenone dioxygenase family protein [Bacillus sp. 165]|uniref:2,4'-dihydroxyacetophenone dioxygenase family protein n=1 Tax=Bacillus sp. 165 TaxID=1529117 RepID=UPI001ADB629A|nr:2,4'-dihydroxyacetophenone dioxygenase family protein [Bacillus sp. 165]MBO9131045.1 2,4'-dihydroxyacetophenone dioxygenase family protein [Bacillus sp. 165]
MTTKAGQVLDANYVADESIPWVPFFNTEVKFHKINMVTGEVVVTLKAKPGIQLPIHVHHGTVILYTISGQWGYLEHDWVAKANDVVYEPAASLHTFYTPADCEEDTLAFNIIQGALEFKDENGNTFLILNSAGALQMYKDHCEKLGIENPVDITKF